MTSRKHLLIYLLIALNVFLFYNQYQLKQEQKRQKTAYQELLQTSEMKITISENEAIRQKLLAEKTAVVANQQREIAESNRLLAEKLRSELARYIQSK